MRDFLTRLKEQTAEFGNHYDKYIQTVSKYLNLLIQRLEEKKKRNAVHILHPTYDFRTEMHTVANVGENMQEKLNFINAFFALQFLLMNRQAVDHLRMDVMAPGTEKLSVYKRFMINAGNNLRMLTSCYIDQLLNIFLDQESSPEFVILGVGTKSDQDDIDVGIIDDGNQDRKKFNRAISRINQEMIKSAISFHFHLSEHIGDHYYSASIDEYARVLKHEIGDYVIINEMLSAAVIYGSNELFKKYQKEIINRYFYHPDGDNKYHEGYLRGILGEVFSLLAKPMSTTHINFKEDGLRIIKNIICAQKTVFNIDKVNAWAILDDLKAKDLKRSQEYEKLEKALTFFEIFRYLYQLLVTQDEEVTFHDFALKNIRRVAKILGYSDIGKCHAEEHLLVHYYENIQNVRNVVPALFDDLKFHLETNSIFVPLFSTSYQGNMAQDFLTKFKFFRGTSFWDDILDDFKNEALLKKFVNDLNSFESSKRRRFIEGYIEWVKYDFYSLIKFLTILGKTKIGSQVYTDFNNHLLQTLEGMPDVVRKIAYVFNRFPHFINDYLSLNDEKILKFYQNILKIKIYEKEIATIIDDLKYLIKVHLSSSLFFKRFFMRILHKYPESIQSFKNPNRLKEFANGIYSDIHSMRTFSEKKEKLGDYYDFEMMRVGLKTLGGVSADEVNAEFTEFSDRYIITLFDICRQEMDTQYTKRMITDDILAIFAVGGHAREQAYDDDYDIIVLLNSDNREMHSYCNKVVSKMNGEIIKRGTIPHHRFADYFGSFVITLKEIEQLLNEERADIFIEKSQILGARLVVGSHRFENEFIDRIVRPHIFNKKDEYIRQMSGEINSRHQLAEKDSQAIGDNIKECIGGLRDLEMIMLIIKAKCNIIEPVNSKLFKVVAQSLKEMKDDLHRLANALNFLNNLRNAYRLTAGASDIIMPEALHASANFMGYSSGNRLYQEFKKICNNVAKTIQRVIIDLRCE